MARIVDAIARMPLALYRWHCGWLLDHRFLALTHRGRRTGRAHQTMLEVVAFDRANTTAVVVSGFGDRSDWYRNVLGNPDVVVDIGRSHFVAHAHTRA
jgi:deazaflavin-dependent oxidoreductase (nitroreductase family)